LRSPGADEAHFPGLIAYDESLYQQSSLIKCFQQNLQERGEKTSRNLRDFETSVRQVDISLNNATNSLRSLQFGNQFVEYRVEEVDDADLAMPEEKKKVQLSILFSYGLVL